MPLDATIADKLVVGADHPAVGSRGYAVLPGEDGFAYFVCPVVFSGFDFSVELRMNPDGTNFYDTDISYYVKDLDTDGNPIDDLESEIEDIDLFQHSREEAVAAFTKMYPNEVIYDAVYVPQPGTVYQAAAE